jgi:hypothetical protein
LAVRTSPAVDCRSTSLPVVTQDDAEPLVVQQKGVDRPTEANEKDLVRLFLPVGFAYKQSDAEELRSSATWWCAVGGYLDLPAVSPIVLSTKSLIGDVYAAANRYPTPGSVSKNRGAAGSSSSLRRRLAMKTRR